ncbi:conserved Plasmodium protein, unknown function [Plasmodium berghei]|uniref:Calpain catalytic domain-containing protein n=2 Tax=Plasmodium berghei TaxID=5821 RepID=A0A509AX61_PLABA|nr:conserved Plasmodium protein, unknown function [Plasmodium berghei ANKA]CXI97299.1 conserved Plasmodium protein, unknown function [Plasmodium berghei]SCL97510.1 conserved Plasmodium protein, unknown function [Plasmodium berghei]SCM16625.1 conserved Plasmodium protein, unknown function [Plasmodium berghei]SCM18422.1 conserved Plasmodium protein, unknown function [Plasmodium berghei]SCN27852.1 conserved Plasmodium protein, unknown function [Plasmodium berghei]|eukprot:XP_034423507.1 conserved Plasmodium protein, unknown function [Plasmodium berghei ANKA]
MEYIFNKKNKIQIYENNEKVFDLWKKYAIDEVLNLCNEDNKKIKIKNNQDVNVKYKRKKKFDKYIYKWKEINYFSKENEKENNSQKSSDWEKDDKINGCDKNNQNDNYSDIKKRKIILVKEENYLNTYEKQLDNINKKGLEHFYSSHKNEEQKKSSVVVSYENYVNRNVNIEYNENIDFLKYIYSSIFLIKENKVLIPKGNYLYESIYPQTIHGFPLINKLNYYFVKLYINNNWVLVFVDLELPYDKDNNILSCQSKNDEKEIWIYILTKALYKIFRLFNFCEYYLYIFEMLTGYKLIYDIPINLNLNDNMIYSYNKNIIQMVLLNRDKEKASKTNTYHSSSMHSSSFFKATENRKFNEKGQHLIDRDINNIRMKEDICIIDKRKKCKDIYQGSNKIKKRKNLHFFQIYPFEKNLYFIIIYENIKPDKYIKYSDYITKKTQQQNQILKGYKYINKQGNIIISNVKLIPVNNSAYSFSSKLLENNPDKNNQQKFMINDETNVIKNNDISEKTDFINNIKKNNILNKQKYKIIINQNTEEVLQLFKEILFESDQTYSKIYKDIHSKKHKKIQKDVSKWISEIDIEKILKFINVSYSSYYLIKLDNKFVQINKIYNYIYYNDFSFSSTNMYAKSIPQINVSSKIKNIDKYKDEEKGKDNKKKKMKCNENETQINNNTFLLLICSISIFCKKNNCTLKESKENNDPIQTTKHYTNCDKKKKIEEMKLDFNCALNNKDHTFNLSFFTYKEKKEKNISLERNKKKEGSNMMLNYFMNSFNNFNKREQNIKICKKKLISQEDVLSSECFIKQIWECNYERNSNNNNFLFASYINNFLCNILNSNFYNPIFFQSKIEKKSISLKENKEHFFFIYIKDPNKSNLTIEWVTEIITKIIKNEKENNDEEIIFEDKSINCSFFLLEEFLEKNMKMKINSFIKNINLKKENSNKILLKFIVSISREKEKGNIPFYYLIQKINDIKILSYLDIYVCKIRKNNNSYEIENRQNHSEQRKQNSTRINEHDNGNNKNVRKENINNDNINGNPIIIGKFYKLPLKNIFFKFIMFPDTIYDEEKQNEKSEYNYLFLIALKNVEKVSDQNITLQIIAALPNKENYEKSKRSEILTINEVPSFCKRYTFNYYNDLIKNNFHEMKEVKENESKYNNNYEKKNDKIYKNEYNISEKIYEQKEYINLIPSKNKVSTHNENKISQLNDCNNTTKTFTLIKKIKINDKSYFSYGSIFVELKNGSNFKNIKVKIFKLKKNELPINTIFKENETENIHKNNNDEKVLGIQNPNQCNSNHTSLDSFINSYKRNKIFNSVKRGKKKQVFIKHLEIDSKESCYLYIKIRKSDKIDEKKNKNEMVNILTTKINQVKKETLIKPCNNDFFEIILNVYLNFSSDVILKDDTPDNEFEMEIKKYLKYKNIHFEDLKKNVTLDIKKEIIPPNIFALKNELQLYFRTNYEGIFNNFLWKKKINLPKSDDNKLPICKSLHISTQCENNILISENIQFENKENMYLYKDELFDLLSSICSQKQLYDLEKLFSYISFKYFENDENKMYMKTFIKMFESIQKNKNYLIFDEIEKFEKNILFSENISNTCNDEMENNKNSQNENCEDTNFEEISHLFTYPNETRKIIDGIKSFYNLKNKMDVLKLKMDAELQLPENIFPFFNKFYGKMCNIYDIIKYNYSHLEELEHVKTKSEQNKILSHLLDEGIFFIFLKNIENENKYETLKIIPPTIHIHDIVNLVKKIDSFSELSYIKDMKLNVSKIIKERKNFIENIKNLLKHKKLKNLTSEELKDLYKKGVKINLDIYNSNILQMIKNQYTILNILISIKDIFKKNNLKKCKTKDNEQNIAENVINDQMQFLQLFQTCSDLIKNNQNIQLNDFYNNIFKDSQKVYDELTSSILTV